MANNKLILDCMKSMTILTPEQKQLVENFMLSLKKLCSSNVGVFYDVSCDNIGFFNKSCFGVAEIRVEPDPDDSCNYGKYKHFGSTYHMFAESESISDIDEELVPAVQWEDVAPIYGADGSN